jgi:hypothetical protein
MHAFQHAILDAVRAPFGDALDQSGLYDPTSEFDETKQPLLDTPCILIGVESGTIPSEDDPPQVPGRFGAIMDCWAECWLSIDTEDLPARLPEYAHAMASLVMAPRTEDITRRGNRWGLGDAVSWPDSVSYGEGQIDALNGRTAWMVRWQQWVYTDGRLPA